MIRGELLSAPCKGCRRLTNSGYMKAGYCLDCYRPPWREWVVWGLTALLFVGAIAVVGLLKGG